MRRPSLLACIAFAPFALLACSRATDSDAESDEGAFSSNQATLLDFEFDGELVTDSAWDDKAAIQEQLLYTIGHLNGDNSVGRLDDVTLTNIQKTQADGKTKIKYHAKLPVGWGSKTNLPTT